MKRHPQKGRKPEPKPPRTAIIKRDPAHPPAPIALSVRERASVPQWSVCAVAFVLIPTIAIVVTTNTDTAPLSITIPLLILLWLLVLSFSPQFRPFRDVHQQSFAALVAIGVATAGLVFGSVFLTGFNTKSSEVEQVERLLQVARTDADRVRIHAQTVVVGTLRNNPNELSKAFHKNNLQYPDELFKNLSEPMVSRSLLPETLSQILSLKSSMSRLVHIINEEDLSNTDVRRSVVIYIDSLVQFDVLLPLERLRVAGVATDAQVHDMNQRLVADTAAVFQEGFVQRAFLATNLIGDFRNDSMGFLDIKVPKRLEEKAPSGSELGPPVIYRK
jgi:hypothetical protein